MDQLSVIGCNGLSTMLTIRGGMPFWRQRMTAKILPILIQKTKSIKHKSKIIHFNCLFILSQIVCTTPVAALGDSMRVMELTGLLVNGLSIYSPFISKEKDQLDQTELVSFFNAAVVGIMRNLSYLSLEQIGGISRLERLVEVLVLVIVTGSVVSSDIINFIPCLITTLQGLQLIAKKFPSNTFQPATKDMVVDNCRIALDHPSHYVRQGGVRVRNVWALL